MLSTFGISAAKDLGRSTLGPERRCFGRDRNYDAFEAMFLKELIREIMSVSIMARLAFQCMLQCSKVCLLFPLSWLSYSGLQNSIDFHEHS